MTQSKSITRVNLFGWIATILLISFMFICFFIYQQYTKFQKDTELLHRSYSAYKQDILRNDVNWAIGLLIAELPKNALQDKSFKLSAASNIIAKLKTIQPISSNIIVLNQQGQVACTLGNDNNKPFINPDAVGQILNIAKKPSGGFVHPDHSTTTDSQMFYVKSLGPFWIVVAELREKEIIKAYGANRNRMKVDIAVETFFIVLLALFVIAGALRVSWVIAKSQYKEIALITEFLKKALKDMELNEENFHYREFKFIATASINMVEKIRGLMAKLQNLTIESEVCSTSKSIVIDDLSYDMRHELKRIKVASKSLRSSKLDDAQREHLNKAVEATCSIAGLLNNITNAVHNCSSLPPSSNSAFALTHVTEKLLPRISTELKHKKIEFKLVIDQDVAQFFFGDQLKITQILINLIENAVHFTQEGYVKLHISQQSDNDKTVCLKLKISDTGPGAPDDIAVLTDLTNETIAHSSTLTVASLKLSVCKELLVALNGDIKVESDANLKTTFTVTLPLRIATEQDIDTEKNRLALLGRGRNALVIENDPVNRDVEIFYFSIMGFAVDSVAGEADAMLKLQEKKYSIVFIDCEVNEYSGVEIAKQIRVMEKATKEHVTIIALNGADESKEWDAELAAGFDDYILKPLNMDAVAETVKKQLF